MFDLQKLIGVKTYSFRNIKDNAECAKASLREPTLYLLEKRGALSCVQCDAAAMETASALGVIRIFEEREKIHA